MSDKAYIVANEQQEREVLEKIKEAYDTVYNMESGILESYAHID